MLLSSYSSFHIWSNTLYCIFVRLFLGMEKHFTFFAPFYRGTCWMKWEIKCWFLLYLASLFYSLVPFYSFFKVQFNSNLDVELFQFTCWLANTMCLLGRVISKPKWLYSLFGVIKSKIANWKKIKVNFVFSTTTRASQLEDYVVDWHTHFTPTLLTRRWAQPAQPIVVKNSFNKNCFSYSTPHIRRGQIGK